MPNIRKSEENKVQTMNVSIPKNVKDSLDSISTRLDVSRSSVVVEALKQYIENDTRQQAQEASTPGVSLP